MRHGQWSHLLDFRLTEFSHFSEKVSEELPHGENNKSRGGDIIHLSEDNLASTCEWNKLHTLSFEKIKKNRMAHGTRTCRRANRKVVFKARNENKV